MRILKKTLLFSLVIVIVCFIYTIYTDFVKLDDTVPQISADGDLFVEVGAGEKELLEGVSAYDEEDGDLTNKIMLKNVSNVNRNGCCKAMYVVFDSNGNQAECYRNIMYSNYLIPQFKLRNSMVYNTSEKIDILENVESYDVFGDEISYRIRLEETNVEVQKEGEYFIKVSVTDNMGGNAELEIPVIVSDKYKNAKTPEIELNDYIVYTNVGAGLNLREYINSVTAALEISSGDVLTTEDVIVSGDVDYNTPGVYKVNYSVTDRVTDETAVESLIVVVQ